MSEKYEVPEHVWAFLESSEMDLEPAPDGPAWRLVKIEWGNTDREARFYLLDEDGQRVYEPNVFWAFSTGPDKLNRRAFSWVPSEYHVGQSVSPYSGGFVLSGDWKPDSRTAVFVESAGQPADVVYSPWLRMGEEGKWHSAPHLTFQYNPGAVPLRERVSQIAQDVEQLKQQMQEVLKKLKEPG
jgi:hypothetical protein